MSQASSRDRRYDGSEVAVCGMAGRFPGAQDVQAFWRNLRDGVESVTRFSLDELHKAGESPERLEDPRYVPARPVLEGVEEFDASFFGMSPREAEILDPQHRVFLEVAWEALENAGYDTSRFEGAVSLFAGTSFSNYLIHNLYENRPAMESYGDMLSTIQNVPDSLATMAAYKLGLKGPCCAVQTFCSSSLVAVHLASQSLLNLESDVALAGGVSIHVPQTSGYLHEEGSIVSPDGRCRAFDARAEGTVFGSGAGVVVLKRLEDALEDGDDVLAVILGSATNNDGPLKASFAAPAVVGQTEVIVEALASADVAPDTISCIEAHGTGTRLGDPAEVSALTRAFRTGTDRRGFCALGSVKTNVGHLDAAAGVTGLIKLVLALKNGQIPPSLHFKAPNPEIDFASSPFFVNDQLRDWAPGDAPRRAGVSAFGVGGTNAHVVVEEPPGSEASESVRPAQLLVISARTKIALGRMSENLARHLEEHEELSLADVAWTLQVGRRGFERRSAAICRDRSDAIRVLRSAAFREAGDAALERRNPAVALRFVGGSISPTALRECRAAEPGLAAEIDRGLDAAGSRAAEVRSVLEEEGQAVEERLAAAAAVIVQHAVARLVLSWGVRPRVLVGTDAQGGAALAVGGHADLASVLAAVLTDAAPGAAPSDTSTIPVISPDDQGQDSAQVVLDIAPTVTADGLLQALRSLWMAGVDLDWGNVRAPERPKRVPLPTYPFERERHWVDPLDEEPVPQGSSDWLYRSLWKSALPPLPQAGQRHLVLEDPQGPGRSLAERLRLGGEEVVTVRAGSSFGGDKEGGFEIDPGSAQDYARLWDELEGQGFHPDSVVHTWSMGRGADDVVERLEDGLERGFHSVRHLAAAATRNGGEALAIRVVTEGLFDVVGSEPLRPEVAPVLGLLRVLPQEHESLRCVALDVDPGTADQDRLVLVAALEREVRSTPADSVVALRGRGRWVQAFEPLADRPVAGPPVVREGGTYLVTGGLGNVGFTHAAALARRAPVNVILTARSALPDREEWEGWIETHGAADPTSLRIRRVLALESLGTQVMPVAADVTDEEGMGAALDAARRRFGALNGVVHAAGELSQETFVPVRDLSDTVCARQLDPKVRGLLVLDRLLAGDSLDFVLLTSSLSTVLGGYGYGAYAGANAFLDAYAVFRSREGGTPWSSVDWDHWGDSDALAADGDSERATGLAGRDGLAAIDRLLGLLDVPRVVVSIDPLDPRLERWVALDDSPQAKVSSPGAPEGGTRDEEVGPPATDVERALVENEAVTAAAVVAEANGGGGGRLEAYVTFGDGAEPTTTELRAWLKQRLPPERVPSSFVVLDALPVGSDGAPDRDALSRLVSAGSGGGAGDSMPRTRTQTLLAGIWQETLGRDKVSLRDNFFDLGGHSLLSVRVAGRIEKEMGIRIDPRDLIFQTLEQLAAACEARARTVEESARA